MMTIATVSAETARQAMVASQLRTSAVNDVRVVEAMAAVPREAFVPADQPALAYRDTPVPIAPGRWQNPPLATGRLLTEAEVAATDRVLLIGAAGGYTAAVLARLAARVVAVEADAALADHARAALAGVSDVELIEGPLADGHPAGAPYDLLVVDGAVAHLPAALVDQLRVGARIVTGRIEQGVTRLAAGVRSAGGVGLVDFADIDCVILPGFDAPRGFQFPG